MRLQRRPQKQLSCPVSRQIEVKSPNTLIAQNHLRFNANCVSTHDLIGIKPTFLYKDFMALKVLHCATDSALGGGVQRGSSQ